MLGRVMSGHSGRLRMEDRGRRWRLGMGELGHAMEWIVSLCWVVGVGLSMGISGAGIGCEVVAVPQGWWMRRWGYVGIPCFIQE